MKLDVDPSFQGSGARARKRHRARLIKQASLGAAAFSALALVFWGLVAMLSREPVADAPDVVLPASEDIEEDFALVQSEGAADTGVRIDPTVTFLHLRRDPMILRFARSTEGENIRKVPGPRDFAPGRAGVFGPERLSVLQDSLFDAEKRLVTTLPSSRDDFALFQAQRSQALDVGLQPVRAAPVEAGDVVRVEEDGSWGELLEDGSDEGAAIYVETRIENTTSTALTLREQQRRELFSDEIIVLQAERKLEDVLRANGLSESEAQSAARASARQLNLPERFPAGSIIALRLRPEGGPTRLTHMSIYGPDGYLASLGQVGAGRFAAAADPWIKANLLERSGQVRRAAQATGDIRLLDALYSAGIRNGLSTSLVGELIVIMSQSFDLDRFVTDGDEVTILFASEQGRGLSQLFYVGINGPSGDMPCYVARASASDGYGCFDFNAPAGVPGGGLGGGLMVPVDGVKTSGFGPRHHPILKQLRNHNGVDWAAPTGTPVRAAAGGTLSRVGDGGGYGNVIYIRHPGGLETRYAHLNAFANGMRQGTQVGAGEVIGYVGTTGRSTGPHLHFELRVSGQPVNPLTYAGVSGGTGSGAVEALVNQIIKVESAGVATAKNPLSTATGLGQFIESTWLRMMRDYRPDLTRTMNRAQLLALRTDPALSREMVRNLARENESFLRARGHQITAGRLYLAHFLGPAGAHKALNSRAEQTVLEVMGASVVNANPFLRGKTIAYLHNWSDRKMRGAGRGGTVVASAPAVRVVPPEVQTFRKHVDEMLEAL